MNHCTVLCSAVCILLFLELIYILGTSSIIFSLVIILHISFSNLHFLQYFIQMSLIVYISFSTLIVFDKTISLALPFFYSTIITHSSTMKITSITWIVAGLIPTPVLMNIQTQTCRIAILTLQSLCLMITTSCHIYIWIVAHSQVRKIQKHQQSAHQSIQRLNSGRDSIYSVRGSISCNNPGVSKDMMNIRPGTWITTGGVLGGSKKM